MILGLVLGTAFVCYLRTTDGYCRFIIRCCDWMERHGL